MTNTFDETGISLDSLSEVQTGLGEKFKAKFGEIKTDPRSVFGQIIGIFAEVVSDQNDLVQKVVNAYNPSVAGGVHLDNLVAMNGINRKDSEYSSITIKCTANIGGCTIPAGSVVSHNVTNEKFITDDELILAPSTDGNVSATAEKVGVIEAAIGTVTKIETPIYGWASVTNESEAVVGKDRETDTELRLRRLVASERTGLCNASSLYTALFNIDEVSNVAVYDKEDLIYGLPPLNIWCVIKGGNDTEIAATIFNNVAAGVLTWGNTSVVYSDPITGEDYTIKFGRSIDLRLRIKIDITTNKNFPSDGYDQIRQNLVDFVEGRYIMPDGLTAEGMTIHNDVYFSRLFTPVMAVEGHYINYLKVSIDGSDPSLQTNLPVGKNEIVTLASIDVEFV